MRICLWDLRSPPKWTKADRSRECERAVVSVAWDQSRFGLQDVLTMPNVQPGVWRRDTGVPVVTENGYMALWGRVVDEKNWTLRNPDGSPVNLWAGGGQSVTAVDLSRVEVVEARVGAIVGYFGWARGISLDYFTNLAWLAPEIPLDYWNGYDLGLAHAVTLLRRQRPDWHLIGHQYHRTRITHYPDALFHEYSPTHFGQTFYQLEAEMDSHGGGKDWVIEMFEAERYGPAYVRQVIDLVNRRGCLLSFERDAKAGVGIPG